MNITSNGVLGGWVSADPANGSISAGQSQQIAVKYDVSQNEFQGIYTADILITTNAQPLAKVCRSLSHRGPHRQGSGIVDSCPVACCGCSPDVCQHMEPCAATWVLSRTQFAGEFEP